MTGTFIDTIIICTMTGLSIVISGAWLNSDLEGVQITDAAFQHGSSRSRRRFSSCILMLCLIFFAFTTILGWSYYSERCLTYLRGKGKPHTDTGLPLAVHCGSVHWSVSDCRSCMGHRRYFQRSMAFPNVIALIALSGVVAMDTKQYFAEKRHLLK